MMHRGFIRGVEAAIAVMILLFAFQFLYTVHFSYKPHESRVLTNLASSTLATYYPIIRQYLLIGDLRSLQSLLDSVIPSEYGYMIQATYLQPFDALFGSVGVRPLSTVIDFPGSVVPESVLVQDEYSRDLDTQATWTWYRVPFTIINDETDRKYVSQAQFILPWQDVNLDDVLQPVDHSSFRLYLNDSEWAFTITNVTSVNSTDIVSLTFTVDLIANETVDGFFYYRVIG